MSEIKTSKKRKYVLTKLMNGSSTYLGRFQVDGRPIALCDNPKRVIPNPKDDDREIRLSYSKDYPFHSIEIDPTSKAENEWLSFLKKDSRIFVKGEKSISSSCIYELIDVQGEEIRIAQEIKKRGKLQSVIYSMPIDELVKICYYFNVNITGKTVEAIYGTLLHWENGVLYNPLRMGDKTIIPMDLILSEGIGAEFEIRTAVNKAIITNVIKNKGGVYFLGDSGTPLGQTPEQIYSYMEQNKPIFEGTLKNLLKNEVLPESIDYSGELDQVREGLTKQTAVIENVHKPFTGSFNVFEREEYEKEAAELGIQGNIPGFKDETLYNKVVERRIYLAQKKG